MESKAVFFFVAHMFLAPKWCLVYILEVFSSIQMVPVNFPKKEVSRIQICYVGRTSSQKVVHEKLNWNFPSL